MNIQTLSETAKLSLGFYNTVDGFALQSDAQIAVVNPATGQVVCNVPKGTLAQLDNAVAAATRAQRRWAALDRQGRALVLSAIVQSLVDAREEIAALVVLEQGKPFGHALDEVSRSVHQFEGLLKLQVEDEQTVDSTGRRVLLLHRPLGVVGAITPWNMPVVLMIAKLAHALHTGNAIVIKPSPLTPLSALRLGRLFAQVSPPGLINVIAGDAEIGNAMTRHTGIHKIAFTGSTETGRRVMASASGTLKRVTLELGGNDAAIVLGDVDPKQVAPLLFAGAFSNAGQICMAIKRLYLHERVHDAVCEELVRLASELKVGDGAVQGTQMGPLQNRMQYEIVNALIEDAGRSGGHAVNGGQTLDKAGYFVSPTIVTGLREGSRLVDEEQFGPVLPVLRFTDIDDAIARANASSFGLGASVWTGDAALADAIARRLDAGTVWINRHIGLDVNIPFGGARQSGLGAQFSTAGLKRFMQTTAVFAAPIAE